MLLFITACNREEERYPLDWSEHPGVLRGTWTGTIINYPAQEITTTLLLSELKPICKEPLDEGQCALYTFSGNVQVGNNSAVAITGEGQAPSPLYRNILRPQTSPPQPPSVTASFTENATQYDLEVYYQLHDYSGEVTVNGQTYTVILQP
jgi:hypothetical protein